MATESELVSGDAPHVPVDDSNGHISAANSDMVNVRALAPESVEVEVVRWTLPIDVLPADPMHIPFRRAVSKLRWGDDGTVA